MESNKKYVIGLDFGTDSCRALVVDTYTGREMATGVSFYPRWKAGLYCDAHNNRYRQHPLDYIESMIEAVHIALSDLKEEEIASICGLCFDTTGSTPALTDKAGMPLALCPEFAEEPDAMFILWKDHTAVREAEQINALINKRNLDYLLYEGGTYSSEWVWSKVLHIINTNVAIKDAAYAWVEHCDWMTGLVTGNTIPEQIFRSRCAAGHKAMWHASWGLPSGEVLEELDAHVHALLKLSKGEKSKDMSQCYKIGKEYVLDATHATLKHASGVNKTLTVRETGLLQMLCEKRGDVIRREAILDKFWNTEDDYFASRSLDVFVTKLRKFLSEDESVTIKTVKGVGLILIEN